MDWSDRQNWKDFQYHVEREVRLTPIKALAVIVNAYPVMRTITQDLRADLGPSVTI
jgi:hypothetical protein